MSGTSEKRILKQRGLLSVVFGVLFLLAAIYITGSNLYEDQQAGIASSRIMKQLQIREEKLHAPNDLPKISGSIPSEEKETEMPEQIAIEETTNTDIEETKEEK